MSAPLVERLQKAADRLREKLTYRDGSKGEQLHWPGPDIVEAASTIEAQAAEIERLTVENSTLAADQCHEGYGDEYGNHQCRVIDRLRSELAAKDAAVQILLGIPLVCVTDAEIAHAKEQRAAAIRASGKEG